MTSRQGTGRLVGGLYLAMASFAAFDITWFPGRFIVPGDPAATAAGIAAAPLLFRLWTVVDLISGVFAIYLAVALYQLFKDVDRKQTWVLVAMVLVQVPMWFAFTLTHLAPLVLLNGSGAWSAFDTAQLNALALGSLRLFERGVGAVSAYWGLWLVPFGILVYKSRFIPRILGVFMLASASAYLVSAATHFVFPAWYAKVFWGLAPVYGLGELGIVGWLLLKGAREDPARASIGG
jgi:hypothetical protein